MHPSESKQQLRESIIERLAHMSEKDRADESRSICRRLKENIPEGSGVCVYSALKKTEPDLTMLIEKLLKRGDKVYFPFFEGDHFIFKRAMNLDELKPGKLKILEPPADSELADPKEIDFVLVPGRAFDRNGNRLGRGNGGYDYWIADQRMANPKTAMWGVAFECQIVNEVPVEEHDRRVDGVVTARTLLSC
ncbi:5-formyltetrahydrofolate cyclo-ligase [Patescibacteria group bacterium]|nr:5-formyltetrahydrofolate cyclo-ligase [Patescibacteria group bacterium]